MTYRGRNVNGALKWIVGIVCVPLFGVAGWSADKIIRDTEKASHDNARQDEWQTQHGEWSKEKLAEVKLEILDNRAIATNDSALMRATFNGGFERIEKSISDLGEKVDRIIEREIKTHGPGNNEVP